MYGYPYACLNYGGSIVSFEIGRYESSDFLFFKMVLAILGPLRFPKHVSISLSVSTKKPAGILIAIALNLWTSLGWHFAVPSCILTRSVLTAALGGRPSFNLHFTDEETKDLPQSHSWPVAEPGS